MAIFRLLLALVFFIVGGMNAYSGNVLFIVGNTTLTPADAAIKSAIESYSNTVTLKTGAASVVGDTVGKSLVVISSTVISGDVNTKFRGVLKPVITWESGLFSPMGLTGAVSGTDFGSMGGQTAINIKAIPHPLNADGLYMGMQSIYTSADAISWGNPNGNAIKIAALSGDPTKSAYFAYEKGSAMVGLTAPARRVGLFLGDVGASKFTQTGTKLFGQALLWSLGYSLPVITTPMSDMAVGPGQTAAFWVEATGMPIPSCTWMKNSVLIPGANACSYTTDILSNADNGNIYKVNIANLYGTVSDEAQLTVLGLPSISVHPQSTLIRTGNTVELSVIASGSGPLTYQWNKNNMIIPGANAASFSVGPLTMADNGSQYSCIVRNTAGSITSNSATINTVLPITLITPIQNAFVRIGNRGNFSIEVSGTPPFEYEFFKNGISQIRSNSSVYTIPPATLADQNSRWMVWVYDVLGGTPFPGEAILTVGDAPSIVTQPMNQSVGLGNRATFSVGVGGDGPLTIQWRKNGTAISGANANSYTTPPTTAADLNASFDVFISSPFGSITSNSAILTLTAIPVITLQPVNALVNLGESASFTVAATSPIPLMYQWQKNGVNIAGANSPTYTLPVTVEADGGAAFRCQISNSLGSITSNPANLIFIGPPVITTQPTHQTVILGQPATFSVVASGPGPLTYQWRKHFIPIPGATSPTYTIAATESGDNLAVYSCLVSNATTSIASDNATLTLQFPLTITTNISNRNLLVGRSSYFRFVVSGTGPITYQWFKNGVTIPGAIAESYSGPPVTLTDNGSQFYCTATNSIGSITSAIATLTVFPGATYPLVEGFETGTLPNYWTVSTALRVPAGITNAGMPYAGSYHYRSAKSGSYYGLTELVLTIDLSGRTDVELSFFHKLLGGSSDVLPNTFTNSFDGDGVSLSVNGVNWYKLQGTTASEGATTNYRNFRVNISALALTAGITLTDATRIKFQHYSDFFSGTTDEHYFDNITVQPLPPNILPTVSITSPANGSTFLAPANIPITAVPMDEDGTIRKVEFYRNGTTLISTDSTSPYTVTWNAAPAGNYALTALAYDNRGGNTRSEIVTVTVNERAPLVAATASPIIGGAPLLVAFTATNTGGPVTDWIWNFGDGSILLVQNPTHTFILPGSYPVSLTARGPGGISTSNLVINVIAPPAVTITATPITGTRPLSVAFTVTNTGGAITGYSWNFGNGATSTAANPTYTYTNAGTFTARLTASNLGGSSVDTKVITVNPMQYTLTNCITGGGTTIPPQGTSLVNEGVSTPLFASPNMGNRFSTWRVQAGSAMIANPLLATTSVILSSNATVCADFVPNTVRLTVTHTGNCTTLPSNFADILPGENFSISAIADPGSTFLGWSVNSGNAIITNPALASTSLSMTSASTINAECILAGITPANKKLAISGELSDAAGNPIGSPTPATVDLSIKLWSALTAGTVLYSETFLGANAQAITVDEGFFVARLGEGLTSGNLQQVIRENSQLWVEVTVEGTIPDVLSPRTPLTASAYALGGSPTLAPLASPVLHGNGDPNTLGTKATIGAYYVNDLENTTWLKISSGWSLIK